MKPAERSAYLARLGLVDWRLRGSAAPAEVVEDETAEAGEPHVAQTAPAEAAPIDVQPQPEAGPPAGDETGQPAGDGQLAALDWAGLQNWLDEQDRRGAQRAVFGDGARDAELLIIGEAPGQQEDQQGLPFVGRAGQLLDRMLAAIGYSRQHNTYITNICKFRPPNNRDPQAEEIAADWPVLERQIELMNPKVVMAVGRVSAQTLLASTDSLGAMRGRVHQYPQRDLPVIVTYHPAYLLRTPPAKAKSWVDLKRVAAMLMDKGAAKTAT